MSTEKACWRPTMPGPHASLVAGKRRTEHAFPGGEDMVPPAVLYPSSWLEPIESGFHSATFTSPVPLPSSALMLRLGCPKKALSSS